MNWYKCKYLNRFIVAIRALLTPHKRKENKYNSMIQGASSKTKTLTLKISQLSEDKLVEFIKTKLTTLKKDDIKDYSCKITLNDISNERVVVIGDVHCDYSSLSKLIETLRADNDFDYIKNAYFIFLGDYIDRGNNMLKTIAFLLEFKRLIGDKCILLRGNHELIFCKDGVMKSYVDPSDTATELNEKYSKDPAFLESFANYFSRLPTYCVLSTPNKNILLVHGSIPKDYFTNIGAFIDVNSGKIEFLGEIPNNQEEIRRQMLLSMMWGDPKEVKKKLQLSNESRFEFGVEQFEHFMNTSKLDFLIRSHEPERDGFKLFYDGRLITIFSSGHIGNNDSQYGIAESIFNVETPKYIIIDNNAEIKQVNIY